jgi:hypothetical protein
MTGVGCAVNDTTVSLVLLVESKASAEETTVTDTCPDGKGGVSQATSAEEIICAATKRDP